MVGEEVWWVATDCAELHGPGRERHRRVGFPRYESAAGLFAPWHRDRTEIAGGIRTGEGIACAYPVRQQATLRPQGAKCLPTRHAGTVDDAPSGPAGSL